MTVLGSPGPHGSLCRARKRQPSVPGETCKRPAGWGTRHPGIGRCKLHGGATPYRHGRYSRVARALHEPTAQQRVRAYCVSTLAAILPTMLPDRDRADELFAHILDEAGWSPDDWPSDEQGG